MVIDKRYKTDRETDRQTDRRRDRQTDGRTDRQTDRQTDCPVGDNVDERELSRNSSPLKFHLVRLLVFLYKILDNIGKLNVFKLSNV